MCIKLSTQLPKIPQIVPPRRITRPLADVRPLYQLSWESWKFINFEKNGLVAKHVFTRAVFLLGDENTMLINKIRPKLFLN